MAGIAGIGVSGLLAYQRALQTVSHNVANANTEGYSRQRVELGTQVPFFQGGGYIGTGVRVQGVERIYDGFMTGQVRTYTSSASHAEVYASHAKLVDEMLADPSVGLSPAIDDFFSELQAVANDPALIPARQSLLTQAETLVDRFSYMNQRFEDIRGQLNTQMDDVTSEINGLASAIANINKDIVLSKGTNPPNDLLDTRDALLNKLAEKVSITTVEQDNGAVNVFVGKGQLLVMNFDAHELKITRNQYDVRQYEVSISSGGAGALEISNQISGGQLGAMLDFRKQVLDEVQNSLGALAVGFSDTFNAQHKLGQDLNGNMGADFFNVPALEARSSAKNSGTAALTATMTDSGQLTSAEYELRFINAASGYTLRNLSDNSTINIPALPNTTSYGFSLDISAGTVSDGDRFLIRPGRRGAQDLSLSIGDASEIAAAAPVRTSANILTNTGNGSISAGIVTDASLLAATSPHIASAIVMQYDGANINVVSGPAPWNGMSFAYSNGAEVTALTGFKFTLKGTPGVGDQFRIESNVGGVGDNRNALLLNDLQNKRLLSNGTASYTSYYGGAVANAGILSKQAQLAESSQSNLLEQAVNARDSLSGVNLDEEAANLVKFQQAYQAASQVIVATNAMFQSLLAALRG